MEIKITTRQILNVLQIISWVLFIGLCVQAGGVIFSALFAAFVKPVAATEFWANVDLSELYAYDRGHFLALALVIAIASVLKALLFYTIIRVFIKKELTLKQPFTARLVRFIQTAAALSLAIGFFCLYGFTYTEGLAEKGIDIPDLSLLHIDGADVWLLMAVVLFIIAQVIKRGVEIQEENDLTV